MARHEVDLAGSAGLVTDVLPTKLDKNVWTTLRNGVARDTSIGVSEFFSRLEVFPRIPQQSDDALTLYLDFLEQTYEESEDWPFSFYPTTAAGVVLAVYSFIFGDQEIFIFCTQRRVYSQDQSGNIFDISPVDFDFNTNIDLGWSGLVFGGILVLNNGVDEPIFWAPNQTDNIATKVQWLSSAPGTDPWPVGWSCAALRGFKSALFALNITDDTGQRFPYLVKFSDFAEPGTLPTEWTATAENSAGDQDIADDFGNIVDALAFRDQLIVWKERSVYGFRFIGGNDVYKRYTISTETGLLARNCLVNTDSFQAAVTNDDLVACDGNTIQSLAHQRNRRGFFDDIDPQYYRRCFVFHNSPNHELWFFKPTVGNDFCNRILVFDYNNKTWVEKDTRGATGAVNSFRVVQEGMTWEEMLEAWSDTGKQWAAPFLGETTERAMISIVEVVGENEQQETLYDSTLLVRGRNLFDGPGDFFSFQAERLSIPLPRGDKVDWASQKQVQYLIPKLEDLEIGEDFEMRCWMGFQREQNQEIKWKGPKVWRPGTERIFFHGSGRFISVKFEVDPGHAFQMSGYDLEYKLVSKY